jgi:hypothetical protein
MGLRVSHLQDEDLPGIGRRESRQGEVRFFGDDNNARLVPGQKGNTRLLSHPVAL